MEIDPIILTVIAVVAALVGLIWSVSPRRRRIPLGLLQLGDHLIATTRTANRRRR